MKRLMREFGVDSEERAERVLFYLTVMGGAFAFFFLGVCLEIKI